MCGVDMRDEAQNPVMPRFTTCTKRPRSILRQSRRKLETSRSNSCNFSPLPWKPGRALRCWMCPRGLAEGSTAPVVESVGAALPVSWDSSASAYRTKHELVLVHQNQCSYVLASAGVAGHGASFKNDQRAESGPDPSGVAPPHRSTKKPRCKLTQN